MKSLYNFPYAIECYTWPDNCGFVNSVALLGASCSEKQAILLERLTRANAHIVVFPDPDEAGARLVTYIFDKLGRNRSIRWLNIPAGNDVDTLTPESLAPLLNGVGL